MSFPIFNAAAKMMQIRPPFKIVSTALIAMFVWHDGLSASDSPKKSAASSVHSLFECLEQAYPDSIHQVVMAGSVPQHILMKDGTTIPWDDGHAKTFDEKLASPDFEDTLSIPYPRHNAPPPSKNEDPGRIRSEPFLMSAYGRDKKEVKQNLTSVTWSPSNRPIPFNKKNGAASALARTARALAQLKRHLEYVNPIGGTFKWRHIAGTKRLSAHSFGIAIDINVSKSRYWRWTPNFEAVVFKRQIPAAIVDVFEQNRFIWGGKWYHFDTMHFEYRPELFCR